VITALLVVLASAGLFAVSVPRLAVRLAPAVAVWLLVPASVAISVAGWFVLGVAAFTWIGQQPEVAEYGPWSPQVLAATTPFSRTSSMAATMLLTAAGVWTVLFTYRRARTLLHLHRHCGRLGAPGALVVVDADIPDAFTTPEVTGRIIVTRGMLRALGPGEQAALLAHERSHLAHRHPWWIAVMDLAAAANPLLRPAAGTIRQLVERWADEDAARTVADRALVARALARAALARHTHLHNAVVTAATGGDVPARVRALMHPGRRAPAPALLAAGLVVVMVASAAAGALTVRSRGEQLFEQAATSTLAE
jgi:Zn-dependent protease with chaperone function